MSRTQAYIYLLVAFVVVASIVFFFIPGTSGTPGLESEKSYPVPQPPYTESVRAQLAESKVFQVLVSYSDRGFVPPQLTINKGNTVRFTNNSYDDVWVASGGGALYPATQESCGVSAFDSCNVMKPGEFWEFTFMKTGEWAYLNNMDKEKRGTVTVQ